MMLPTNVSIRRLTLSDLPHCLDLAAGRGWSREERAWQLLLTAGTGYGIDDPSGAGLAGCLVLTRYDGGLACIGKVLVAERYAGQGVGRRLLTYALDAADGAPVFLYGTENGRSLYERLGFTPVSTSTTCVGRYVDPAGPADAGAAGEAGGFAGHRTAGRIAGVARLTGRPVATAATRSAIAADLPELLHLDGEVFGADRTALLARLPGFAQQFRVAEAAGRLTGFATAWRNVDNTVIGPVIAEDAATARGLIAGLAARIPGEIRLDIDARHPELAAWLDLHGIRPTTVNSVMVHGAPRLPGDLSRQFAPFMVALG